MKKRENQIGRDSGERSTNADRNAPGASCWAVCDTLTANMGDCRMNGWVRWYRGAMRARKMPAFRCICPNLGKFGALRGDSHVGFGGQWRLRQHMLDGSSCLRPSPVHSGSTAMGSRTLFVILAASTFIVPACPAQEHPAPWTTVLLAQLAPGTGPYAPGRYGRMCAADPNRCAPQDRPQVAGTGPCAGRVGCLQTTLDDPVTPPQSRTQCTGMD